MTRSGVRRSGVRERGRVLLAAVLGVGMLGVASVGAATPLAFGAGSISAGEHHASAVMKNATVKCWGLNSDGQVGNGSTAGGLVKKPVSVVGLAGVASLRARRQPLLRIDEDRHGRVLGRRRRARQRKQHELGQAGEREGCGRARCVEQRHRGCVRPGLFVARC